MIGYIYGRMTAPISSISEETLDGVIDRVIYQGGDDGFVVVSVEIKGRREAATVVGHLIGARTGEHVVAAGQWANDARRGLQFKARCGPH